MFVLKFYSFIQTWNIQIQEVIIPVKDILSNNTWIISITVVWILNFDNILNVISLILNFLNV
jgi:hypothetical protein